MRTHFFNCTVQVVVEAMSELGARATLQAYLQAACDDQRWSRGQNVVGQLRNNEVQSNEFKIDVERLDPEIKHQYEEIWG